MLVVVTISASPRGTGWCTTDCSRRASACAVVTSVSVSRTANSSPPRRATSPVASSVEPLAGDRQQLVAGGVTEGVVDVLEVVEVEHQHARRARPVLHRLLDGGESARRLGMAVSWSCSASCARSSATDVQPLDGAGLVQRHGRVRGHGLEDVLVGRR